MGEEYVRAAVSEVWEAMETIPSSLPPSDEQAARAPLIADLAHALCAHTALDGALAEFLASTSQRDPPLHICDAADELWRAATRVHADGVAERVAAMVGASTATDARTHAAGS